MPVTVMLLSYHGRTEGAGTARGRPVYEISTGTPRGWCTTSYLACTKAHTGPNTPRNPSLPPS